MFLYWIISSVLFALV